MKNRQLTQQQIRAYAHYLQMEEKSGATMEKYLRDIRAFACWLDGRDISKELTSEWKSHLVSQDYAPTTVNAMLSALNSLLESAHTYTINNTQVVLAEASMEPVSYTHLTLPTT